MATKKKQVAKKLKAVQPAQKAKGSFLKSPKLWVVVGVLALFGSGIYYGVSTLLEMREEYKDSIDTAIMNYEDEIVYQAFMSDQAELSIGEDGSIIAYTIETPTDIMAMEDYGVFDMLPETGKNAKPKEVKKEKAKVKVDNTSKKAAEKAAEKAENAEKKAAREAQIAADKKLKAANKAAQAAANQAANNNNKKTLYFVGPKALASACDKAGNKNWAHDCQQWGSRKAVDGQGAVIKETTTGNQKKNGLRTYIVKKNGVKAQVVCRKTTEDGSDAGCCCKSDDPGTCDQLVDAPGPGIGDLGGRRCS